MNSILSAVHSASFYFFVVVDYSSLCLVFLFFVSPLFSCYLIFVCMCFAFCLVFHRLFAKHNQPPQVLTATLRRAQPEVVFPSLPEGEDVKVRKTR